MRKVKIDKTAHLTEQIFFPPSTFNEWQQNLATDLI